MGATATDRGRGEGLGRVDLGAAPELEDGVLLAEARVALVHVRHGLVPTDLEVTQKQRYR